MTASQFLCLLYALGAAFTGHCATTSVRSAPYAYALGLFAVSAVLAVAGIREYLTADDPRAAGTRAQPADQPPARMDRAVRDFVVLGWADLESACCLRAWESHGHDHDPRSCTRKGHST